MDGQEIGKLIARLVMDDAQFQKATKDGQVNAKALFQELSKGIGVTLSAGAAFTAVAGFTKSAVQETMSYASAVRDQMYASGQSAEASSKLIQVLDDHKISTEDLVKASKKLRQEGYVPTIETIANLSEEYLKLNTQEDRNLFLAKNFGERDGQKWAETMLQGRDALLAQSDAVAKNLILSESFILQARLAEIQMDNWNDSVQGVKTQIGVGLIGALTGATVEIHKNAQAIFEAANGFKFNVNMAGRYSEAQQQAWKDAMAQAEAQYVQEHATDSATASMEQQTATLQEQAEAARLVSEEFKSLVSTIQNIISQDEKYSSSVDDIRDKQKELQAQIGELLRLGYSPYGKTIQDLQVQLNGLAQQESDLTKQYEQDTKTRIASILLEKLAIDGLTQAEFDMWADYMVHSELMTEEQANRARTEQQLATEIATGITKVRDADARYKQILNELNGKKVKVTIEQHLKTIGQAVSQYSQGTGGGYIPGFASGGDVLANQTIKIAEFEEPEIFKPSVNGRVEAKKEEKPVVFPVDELVEKMSRRLAMDLVKVRA